MPHRLRRRHIVRRDKFVRQRKMKMQNIENRKRWVTASVEQLPVFGQVELKMFIGEEVIPVTFIVAKLPHRDVIIGNNVILGHKFIVDGANENFVD